MKPSVSSNVVLATQWHPTRNKDLDPSKITLGSGRKVWWKCEKGHEWQATVASRSAGNGCPYCSNKRVLAGYNDLATVNTALAAEWHPTMNDGLTPDAVLPNYGKRVWWKCEKGHEWQATPNSRMRGNGCPYCSNQMVLPGYNDLATTNPDLISEWHPTKNDGLGPESIVAGSGKKVWWLCKLGHEWEDTVRSRVAGNGCPYCSGHRVWPGFNDLATTDPALAAQWHPIKNGGLGPRDVSKGSNQKVWWRCANGHEWQAPVNTRSRGSGCPYCSGYFPIPGETDLATLEPEIARQWHPTKNGNLSPSNVTAYSGKKVWWLCERGHEWKARITDRSSGAGCPVCGNKGTSFDEQAIFYYLERDCEGVLMRHEVAGKEVDIHIPSLGAAIEYNGKYWHNRKATKRRDATKAETLREAGVKLLYILEPEGIEVPNTLCFMRRNLSRDSLTEAIEWIEETLGIKAKGPIDVKANQSAIRARYVKQSKAESFVTLYPDIAAEWDAETNHDLDPQLLPPGSSLNVGWICPEGHRYTAKIASRCTKGTGCPYCCGRLTLSGFNDLATLEPEIASQWHQHNNGALRPTDVTVHSGKKVWWKCEKGHEWQATIGSRTAGSGCPYCSGKRILAGHNDLATIRPEVAAEWHPTKNDKLLPTAVGVGSKKRVWWRCKEGHEWQATVSYRCKGKGCPVCRKKDVTCEKNSMC